MIKYTVFGTGSFLNDVFDLIHQNNGKVSAVYQNIPDKPDDPLSTRDRISLLDYEIKHYTSFDSFKPDKESRYVIGCIPVQKYMLIDELKERFGITFAMLIHPTAHLGSNVHTGEGIIINALSVIAPNCYLDDFCSINRSCSIGHDVTIGKYSRLGPSVTSAGAVKIGAKCSIGISATLMDGVSIGDWAVIGSKALVTKDISERVVAYGSPAKVVRENNDADFAKYKKKRSY